MIRKQRMNFVQTSEVESFSPAQSEVLPKNDRRQNAGGRRKQKLVYLCKERTIKHASY